MKIDFKTSPLTHHSVGTGSTSHPEPSPFQVFKYPPNVQLKGSPNHVGVSVDWILTQGRAPLSAAATSQGWDLSTLTVKGLGGKCEESFLSSYSQNNPGYPFQNSNFGYQEWQQSSSLKQELFRGEYFTQTSAMIIGCNIWYTRNTAKKIRVRKTYFLHLCYFLEI